MPSDARCCLLHTAHLSVQYDPGHECLINQWRGYQGERMVQDHAAFIYSCLLAHPCTRVLSDHSALQGSWAGLTSWVAQRGVGRFANRGVRALAWVPAAHQPHNRVAMETVARLVTALDIALFADAAQATAWLLRH